jgi:hypothetical protein
MTVGEPHGEEYGQAVKIISSFPPVLAMLCHVRIVMEIIPL